jgi:hypothetical protein
VAKNRAKLRDRATATTNGPAMLSHMQNLERSHSQRNIRLSSKFHGQIKDMIASSDCFNFPALWGPTFALGRQTKTLITLLLHYCAEANAQMKSSSDRDTNRKHAACAGIYRTTEGELDGYSIMFPSRDVTAGALIERISWRAAP